MNSIVINPKDPNEFQFLKSLSDKLGVQSKVLSEEELEDMGMAVLMKDTDRSDRISEADVMDKLRSK